MGRAKRQLDPETTVSIKRCKKNDSGESMEVESDSDQNNDPILKMLQGIAATVNEIKSDTGTFKTEVGALTTW